MLTPKNFAKKSGLSYDQVLIMCKSGKIVAVKSNGGHFKIFEKELNKFISNNDVAQVTIEDYEKVVRENEKLKIVIAQIKKYVSDLVIS